MERWDTLWDGGWTFCFDDGAFKPSTDSFLLGSFPPLRRGWRVCDLGSGTGLLGLLLLAREPSLTVTGLELSPAACALADRTAAANGLTDRLISCRRRDTSIWRCPTRPTSLPEAGKQRPAAAAFTVPSWHAPWSSCVRRQRTCCAAAGSSVSCTARSGWRS